MQLGTLRACPFRTIPLQYMLSEPCHIKRAFLAKEAVLLLVFVAKMALVLFSGYDFSASYAFDVL